MMQLAAWYQKKISSYDKEEWETMVEQLLMRGTYRRRIVDFSAHARSYLIDVDLVRGSSFPKAKPTLSMRRVVWFALVRLAFLPALLRWWAQQTSPNCARLLLALWAAQLANMLLYCLAPDSVDSNSWAVPLLLMLVLSVVHAQIVSTTERELARLRPRPRARTDPRSRRKLPRYYRRARSSCGSGEGGGSGASAESGASSRARRSPPPAPPGCSAAPPTAPVPPDAPAPPAPSAAAQCRRRHSRHELAENARRKRNKDLTKENILKNLEPKSKPKKAKDSDDEDYMEWKKPEAGASAPIVTFTPPPDDAAPPPYAPPCRNLLTRKRLESFNVRHGHNVNLARAIFAEGDDGFESLNGYYSNASDDRPREKPLRDAKEPAAGGEGERGEQVEGPGSGRWGGKRAGVRFRQRAAGAPDTSDDEYVNVKKKAKKVDYQSSTSEGECSAAPSIALPSHHTMSDWAGQTSNSEGEGEGEESSYGSQSEGGPSPVGFHCADSSWDPFALLDPTSDTVKCTMWERGSTLRAELSAVDISWCVVARAERALAGETGAWPAALMPAAAALATPAARLVQVAIEHDTRSEEELQALSLWTYLPSLIVNYSQGSLVTLFYGAFGDDPWSIASNVVSCLLRLALSALVFFLLCVAERAFKQRFLYAKLFSHLTSARRARKSELPHFRLNTVRNIKTWLSTRSYLRRRGPQRSVDVIVSAAFVVTLLLLAAVSAQLLRESVTVECLWLVEALAWSSGVGLCLLRLLALGSGVERKYRGCLSAILTEQINLHLALEQRPGSKDQLTLANNVLKLAADLLKELDSPFKISGICANHYLYTITKVVILSALSGVLSEMLGFKLKLHKIKIK